MDAEPVTVEEMSRLIDSLRKKKAPGLDEIMAEALQQTKAEISPFSASFINQCLAQDRIPNIWKQSEAIVLSKGEDKGPQLAKSYQPICLLNVCGKLQEKVPCERILRQRVSRNAQAAVWQGYRGCKLCGNSRRNMEGKCNRVLESLSTWRSSVKLKMAPVKTTHMLFKGIVKRDPIIKVEGPKIRESRSNRYLGVTLDEKMNFSEHVETCAKAMRVMNRIISIGQRDLDGWGYLDSTAKLMSEVKRAEYMARNVRRKEQEIEVEEQEEDCETETSSSTPDLGQVVVGNTGWLDGLGRHHPHDLIMAQGQLCGQIRVVTWSDKTRPSTCWEEAIK
uniref:(California timema) hypothetical protein n=1 Tax=Timema californicum TaxID=61474 RepID=A0A7R9JDL2_TIMCA|nr:unnamed protein product [Timema californicum]